METSETTNTTTRIVRGIGTLPTDHGQIMIIELDDQGTRRVLATCDPESTTFALLPEYAAARGVPYLGELPPTA
jgi:hypothetical protein